MNITRRACLVTAATAGLAACVRQSAIVLDRQAMSGIKRFGLPTVGVGRSPDVLVINGISQRMAGFGLIGAIGNLSGSIVRGNRSDALVRMMAERDFDPGPALTEMLAAALGAKGYKVVPIAADPKRKGFLPTIAADPSYDAVLDCYVSIYGFLALSDADDSPYRASISVPSRLVGPGAAVLMQDTVTVQAGTKTPEPGTPATPSDPPVGAGAPLEPGTFRSFSDVEKDPVAGVDALRTVFQTAAAGIVRRAT